MCGICGIYNLEGDRPIDREILGRMLQKIRHRGPDGSQMLVLKQAALGFNRLSFLDLDGGMQPLQNEDRTVSMICNGEIFNYQDLKEELLLKGHTFRTGTDVEVMYLANVVPHKHRIATSNNTMAAMIMPRVFLLDFLSSIFPSPL